MAYNLKLTEEFLKEMENIWEYITNNLKEEDASNRLRKKIIDSVNLLEDLPKIFAKIEKYLKLKDNIEE